MSIAVILLILLPIAYGLTLAFEVGIDKLLRSKPEDFAEWGLVYEPPICPRRLLLPLVYFCLVAGTLYPASFKGQLLSCFLLVNLLVVCLIDYKYQFIFDEQNLLLAIVGLWRIFDVPYGWLGACLAAAGAFFVMLVLALVSRGAIGGGDVKLMAALGLWFGPMDIIHTFVYGSIAGGIGGIILLLLRKKGRKDYFAFGPYLCLGAVYVWYLVAADW